MTSSDFRDRFVQSRYLRSAPILLAVAILIAFSNVPGNAFALDDQHTIEQNPWVRSLSNIPRYFVDASTNSVVRANMDYRPILQTTYAINYAMSGASTSGFDAWHTTNLLIHFACAWCVVLLGRRLIGGKAIAPVPGISAEVGDCVSLMAAFIFAIHPTSAACVNYISARGTSLTAFWVLLAIIFYIDGMASPKRRWQFMAAWACVVLAVLTKIEGISALGAIVVAEFLLNPELRERPLWRRPLAGRSWLRLLPFVIAGAALVALWKSRTGILNITRSGTDVTPLDYLVTQFRAWWYYIGKIFLPTNLIADYQTYPRSKWADVIALRDYRPLVALAGWLIVGGGALAIARRAPAITFCILCFFIFLAPHSSIVPLAEPVNEHRPYLPSIVVLLLICAGLGVALSRFTIRPRTIIAGLAILLAVPLFGLTRQRNRVWHDMLSLWGDTVAKVPTSDRAQANYGFALADAGRIAEAEKCYREAIRLSPGLHYAHTNLALILLQKGDVAAAMRSFDTAVLLAPDNDIPYAARGQFRAQIRDITGAAADMETAVKLGSAPLKELAAAAECLARLGRNADAERYIARGRPMDPAAFDRERTAFRALMGAPFASEQVADGFAWLQKEQPIPAEGCFREALRLDPADPAAPLAMGILKQASGKPTEAAVWFDKAVTEHPKDPDALHYRGQLRAAQRQWEAALTDFRAAKALGGIYVIRETAAIGESLLALGRMPEAEAEFRTIDPVSAGDLDKARQAFRAATSIR